MDLPNFAHYLEDTYDHISVSTAANGCIIYHGNGTSLELLLHDAYIIMKTYPVHNYANPTRSFAYDKRDTVVIHRVVEDWCMRYGPPTGLPGVIPREYQDEIFFWFKHLELMGYEVDKHTCTISSLVRKTSSPHARYVDNSYVHCQLTFIDTGISAMWHVRDLWDVHSGLPKGTWAFEDLIDAQLKLKKLLERTG